MPWTPKQVRLFFSKGSPLKPMQKAKVADELRANPAMGQAAKGTARKIGSLKQLMGGR